MDSEVLGSGFRASGFTVSGSGRGTLGNLVLVLAGYTVGV